MKIFITFLFLIFHHILFAQDNSKYKEVDDFVKTFPLKVNSVSDLNTLQREIKYKFKDEELLARAAFVWIANNIEYDCEGLKKGAGHGKYELNDVLQTKKAICAGYANLFQNFCDEFQLNCHTVSGFAYNNGDAIPQNTVYESNHAWNIVAVKNEWKIIDATWGSGWTQNNCESFEKELKNYYFFADTNFIIQTHFPDDSSWQLKKNPFTFEQFKQNSALEYKKNVKNTELQDSLYNANLNKDSIIVKNVGETIRFILYTQVDTLNLISIYSNAKPKINVFDSLKKIKEGYYYDYIVKFAGEYYVEVGYFKSVDSGTFSASGYQNYLIKVKKPSVLKSQKVVYGKKKR